ncbi:hypothetical protein HO173_000991 [Letharia columbiana]|uniref:Uncharacterized protein n=1 Tax=Letharia columbiana TaxID=112416 RepID=A0A8H6G619_9LECA|nr:uncharacterized protein HO173_000991 [Letharia columbiana]KAF6241197.1 hypothetical protein HO173_000991 [Letharia columbiana]
MISPYDPSGKIYTILSEEWTTLLWFFEPVSIPQVFREHLVLVLGWTTGRRGYVSIAMIAPNIPNGANPDHYFRIRSPRRRAVANEITVTLRKNKRFSALVELSYVRLDLVWEVPFAILLVVPRTGLQLMLRAVSMEKIMRFYSKWGWNQAWGQTYRPLPDCLQWAGYCHDQNTLGPPGNVKQGGEAEYPEMTRQPCHVLNGLASSGTVEHDRDFKDEALAGSDSTRSWGSAHRPDDEEDGYLDKEASPCARQEMIYAGNAHCAALAKLLREAQ